jgi:hypothetical protein
MREPGYQLPLPGPLGVWPEPTYDDGPHTRHFRPRGPKQLRALAHELNVRQRYRCASCDRMRKLHTHILRYDGLQGFVAGDTLRLCTRCLDRVLEEEDDAGRAVRPCGIV